MKVQRYISDLPDEILAYIFSLYASSEGHSGLMKNIKTVCMKWNEVCKYPDVWKSVDDPKLTTENLVELSKEGLLKNTTKLNLRYMKISPKIYKQLFQIIENCDNLRILDVSESEIMEQVTSYIAHKCKNLKSLKMDNMRIPVYREKNKMRMKFEGSYQLFQPLIEICGKNLVYLSLCNISFPICENVLTTLPKVCHLLEELHVSCILDRLYMNVSDFQLGCPKLRVLEIFFCIFDITGADATNGFPNLEEFIGNRCTELQDEELYPLLRKSNKLRTLSLNDSLVSCEGLLKVPAKNIEKLYVSKSWAVHSNDFKKVISKWKFSLKELDMSLMNHGVDMALPSLWENNLNCPLEVLHLCGSSITVLTLEMLLQKCELLRYLNVESCPDLPKKAQKIFKTPEEFESLRSCIKKFRSKPVESKIYISKSKVFNSSC